MPVKKLYPDLIVLNLLEHYPYSFLTLKAQIFTFYIYLPPVFFDKIGPPYSDNYRKAYVSI